MKEKVILHKFEYREDDLSKFKEPVNKLATTDRITDLVDNQLTYREKNDNFVIKHNGTFKRLVVQDNEIKTEEI